MSLLATTCNIAPSSYRSLEGYVPLRFNASAVRELCASLANVRSLRRAEGEKSPKAALWLAGDGGIYLMSNATNFCAEPLYADGCRDDDDDWMETGDRIERGDFLRVIPINLFDAALADADREIVILCTTDKRRSYVQTGRRLVLSNRPRRVILSDREYAELKA